MTTDKLTQDDLDARLVIDKEIGDLFGSAFEDFGQAGIRYVAREVKRISKRLKKMNKDGKII